MNSRSVLRLLATVTVGLAGMTLGSASTLYWDGGDANGANGANGGAGTWNVSTLNWYPGAGIVDQAWVNANNDTAIFAGTGGAVSLGAPVTAGNLTFNSSGYVLDNANALTLAGTGNGRVTVASGVSTTVNSTVAGTVGLTAVGPGTLILGSAASSFTGNVYLNGGIVQVSANGNLGAVANSVNFATGALQLTGGFTTARTFLTPSATSGTLDTNGNTLTFSGAFGGTAGNNVCGTFNKIGTGMVEFVGAGSNTTTFGTMNVQQGTFRLAQTSATNNGGGIWNVGTANGTPGSATLQFDSTTSINNPFSVNVYKSGTLNLNFTQGGGMTLNVNNYGTANINANQGNGTGGASLTGGTLNIANGATFTLGYRLTTYAGSQTSVVNTVGTGTLVPSSGSGWQVLHGTDAVGVPLAIDLDLPGTISGAGIPVGFGNNSAPFGAGGPNDSLAVTRISGTNTYTGQTGLGTGTFLLHGNAPVSSPSILGNAASAVVVGEGPWGNTVTILTDGAYTIARDFVWNSSVAGGNTATIGGNTASTSVYSGNFDLTNYAPATLTLAAVAGGTVNLSGNLTAAAGTRSLAKTGPGTVNLTGAGNTLTGGLTAYSGRLNVTGNNNTMVGTGTLYNGFAIWNANQNSQSNVNFGATPAVVTLSGANGSLAGVTGWTLNDGTQLFLDNDGAGNNNNARLKSTATLAMTGGELKLRGASDAATPTSQTVGAVTLTAGQSVFTVTPQAGNNVTLTTGTVTRTAGSALFRGAGLGSGTGATVTLGNGAALLDDGIIPWAVADNGTTQDVATHGANGVAVYSAYTAAPATIPTAASTNYDVTGAVNVGAATTTINALRLSSGGSVTIPAGAANKLKLDSGALVAQAGNNGISGVGYIAVGTGATLYAHTIGDLTLNCGLDGTISTAVIKDGAGTLTFPGPSSNYGYGGSGVIINNGTVKIGQTNALPTGQPVTVYAGGTFDLNGYSQQVAYFNGDGTFGNSSTTTDAVLTYSSGTGTGFAGRIVDTLGAGTRKVSLVKAAGGQLAMMTTANTYSGGTTITGGNLLIAGDGSLGAVPAVPADNIWINGGTLNGYDTDGLTRNYLALNVNRNIVLGPSSGSGSGTLSGSAGIFVVPGVIHDNGTGVGTLNIGAGTVVLTGTNNYSGGTSISAATLSVSADANLGNAAGDITVTATGGNQYGANSALRFYGTSYTTTSRNIAFNAGNNTSRFGVAVMDAGNTFTLNGNITEPTGVGHTVGNLFKGGPGTLRLTGTNTFTGGLTMWDGSTSNGTIEYTSAAALGAGNINANYSTSVVLKNISGGSVTLGQNFSTVNGTGAFYLSGGDVVLGGNMLAANAFYAATGTTVTFSGAINSTPSLGTANGYAGTFVLNSSASSTGYINAVTGCNVGIGGSTALGAPTGAQYTQARGGTNFFAVGGDRVVSTPIGWGQYNAIDTFSGSYSLTFSANQNVNWYNTNNSYGWNVTAPLVTMSGTINEPACQNFYKFGPGVLAFTNTNTYVSTTTMEAGVLRASDGVGLSANSNVRFTSGGVLETAGTFNRTLGTTAGRVQWLAGWNGMSNGTGSGGFAAYGAPLTVDLNTLGTRDSFVWGSTASFTPTGGALVFGSTTATDVVTFYDNIDFNTAQRTIQVNDNTSSAADKAVLSGNLVGTGAAGLVKTGTGLLELTGTNSYAGKTTVNAGTLRVSGDAFLGAVPGAAVADQLKLDGGTLNNSITFALPANRGVTLGAANGTILTDPGTVLTVSGIVAGSGALAKTGVGTLVLGNAGNSYTGRTTVSAGLLQVAADGALGAAPGGLVADQLTLDGGTLENTANVTLTANRGVTLGAGHGTFITDPSTTLAVNGPVGGTGNLTKTGTGILQLNGLNSYTGTTTVVAGTLQVPGRLFNNGSDKVFIAPDGSGVFGDSIGEVSVARSVAAGASYAGFGSADTGGLNSRADVLAGTNSGGSAGNVTMAWRAAAAADVGMGARSDVLGLTTPQSNDLFVLQMNYNEAVLNGTPENGLYLGWLNGGTWQNAVLGNSGGTSSFVVGGWSAGYGLGTYGLDMTNNVVWAVLNHNSDFSVIPEPSALVLLALAGAGLLRRRR